MVLLTRALGKEKQKENNLEVGSAEIGFGRSLLQYRSLILILQVHMITPGEI